MLKIFKKIFGTRNDRELKKLWAIVHKINDLEQDFINLSDEELKEKTLIFKARYQNGASLDSLLPECFAAVREASRRTLKKRHFDVQLIGGIALHQGKIAEMKTGEGKTLTSTLAAYLNALTGNGVHIVTVNEYLAQTQSAEMSHIYHFLGMTTACVLNHMSDKQRQEAYAADITYGTNNELGFDYLRDNMKTNLESFSQKGHHFAIVDEVDSILIDEARTPLIISGPADENAEKYQSANEAIRGLRREIDYTVDEKSRSCSLTEVGIHKIEKRLQIENLFNPEHLEMVHAIQNALKAQVLFTKDDHYILQEGQIIIVDEFTGRLMPGRRFSDGLHQALEAKENVKIQPENQTLAQITLQNYFRLYNKLAGMTGTAETEATEFLAIYRLPVLVIPTNQPMIRKDHDDILFLRQTAKFQAVANEIERLHKTGQPILVGTVSIEKSELLSILLKRKNIPHSVLNAKNHKHEAEIIANAGQKGNVTISTNMAGRGTDIILGQGVAALGGLYVMGTERHESRRIDNQLRGRSGRQGDNGESRFFISWEDELMRRFNNKANQFIMERFVGDEGIQDPTLTRIIGQVQKRVEGFNYDIRKQLLQYDDVLNAQRKTIYEARMKILNRENLKELLITQNLRDYTVQFCETYLRMAYEKQSHDADAVVSSDDLIKLDYKKLERHLFQFFQKDLKLTEEEHGQVEISRDSFYQIMERLFRADYEAKEQIVGSERMRDFERWVMLQIIDSWWKDHLHNIDHLKEGIGLRSYSQRDPLQEYKREAFDLFKRLATSIKRDTIDMILRMQPSFEQPIEVQNKPVPSKKDKSKGKSIEELEHLERLIRR